MAGLAAEADAESCPDAELLARYLDKTLDAPTRAKVPAHLADCARCRGVLLETAAFMEDLGLPMQEGPLRRPRVVGG